MARPHEQISAIKRRHRPEAELEYAETILFEEMEQALTLLRSGQEFGTAAARHAVFACYSFLQVRGLPGRELQPLENLVWGLDDVIKGVLPELFEPNALKERLSTRKWSRSTAARHTQIYAAACMDALMKSKTNGRKLRAACIVAENAQRWPRVSHGIIKSSTVTNWRDRLMQARSDDSDKVLFLNLSKVCTDGPRASQFLEELLEDGPFAGGIRNRRAAET